MTIETYKTGIGFMNEDSYIVVRDSKNMVFHNCFCASKYNLFGKESDTTLPADDIIVLAGSQETADRVLKELMGNENNE